MSDKDATPTDARQRDYQHVFCAARSCDLNEVFRSRFDAVLSKWAHLLSNPTHLGVTQRVVVSGKAIPKELLPDETK